MLRRAPFAFAGLWVPGQDGHPTATNITSRLAGRAVNAVTNEGPELSVPV
jgi:hypothetical protein